MYFLGETFKAPFMSFYEVLKRSVAFTVFPKSVWWTLSLQLAPHDQGDRWSERKESFSLRNCFYISSSSHLNTTFQVGVNCSRCLVNNACVDNIQQHTLLFLDLNMTQWTNIYLFSFRIFYPQRKYSNFIHRMQQR